MTTKRIVVQVTSDIACPWCWVGKRAIEVAASNLNARHASSVGDGGDALIELELHWHPFQLTPEIPSGTTVSLSQHMTAKFGRPGIIEKWSAHPEEIPMNRSCQASKLPNIEFRTHPAAVIFSTYRAHTLLTCAGAIRQNWSVQNRLKEAMLRMTHKEGKNLDDIAELTAAAQEAGLATTREEVEVILSDEQVKRTVNLELKESRHLPDFDGVPYFTFTDGQHFSGGQPVEEFEAVLARLARTS